MQTSRTAVAPLIQNSRTDADLQQKRRNSDQPAQASIYKTSPVTCERPLAPRDRNRELRPASGRSRGQSVETRPTSGRLRGQSVEIRPPSGRSRDQSLVTRPTSGQPGGADKAREISVTHMHTCMRTRSNTFTHACTSLSHICAHLMISCVYTHSDMCLYKSMHACMYIHVHTHTYTHTFVCFWQPKPVP
jgi:hypothetical protein